MAQRRWRLNAVFFGESFPQLAPAVAGGTIAGILSDIAAIAFDQGKVWRMPLNGFDGLRREICLAWNTARVERLSALEKLQPVVERVLKFV